MTLHREGQCASALVGLSGAASAVREDGAKRPAKEDGGVITATPKEKKEMTPNTNEEQ